MPMTQEELADHYAKRDKELWEQYLLYKSLSPKVICSKWGLTYSGYQQVLYRIKREMNIPKAR